MDNDDYLINTIKVYNAVAEEYAKETETHALMRQQESFVSLVSKGGIILDAGCGPGRDSKFFISQGFQVIGIDLSEKLLEIAKKNVPEAKFYKQDLRNIEFPDNTFDGIWANGSLHHLKYKNIPFILESFHTILKPQGILFINVKKGKGEIERVVPSIPNAKRFYSLFQEKQLHTLLHKAGFTVFESYIYDEKLSYSSGKKSLSCISCFAKKV